MVPSHFSNSSLTAPLLAPFTPNATLCYSGCSLFNFFFLSLYCFCFMFWFFDHKSCGILVPQARIRLHALQGEVLTTRLPGKSPSSSLCNWICLSSHIHRLLSLTFLKSLFKCLIFSASP